MYLWSTWLHCPSKADDQLNIAVWSLPHTLLREGAIFIEGEKTQKEVKEQPEALQTVCGAAESSRLLSPAVWGPGETPLPPHWRGTGHISPWQTCKQPVLYKQREGKDAKMLLQVREADQPHCAFPAGGSGGLKEANVFSILSIGFVPRAAWCWHVIPVTLPRTLPPAQSRGIGSSQANLREICLWYYQGSTFFTLREFSVFSGKATSTKFPRWAPQCI